MRFYFSEVFKGNYILLEINDGGEILFKSTDDLIITEWSPNLALDSYFYKDELMSTQNADIKVGEVTLSNVSYMRTLFINNREKIVKEITVDKYIELVSGSIVNQIVAGIEKDKEKDKEKDNERD